MHGGAKGDISASAGNVGLRAELDRLSNECSRGSDLQVNYYCTGLPDNLPINIEELTNLIKNFPESLKNINGGKGIPVKVRIFFVRIKKRKRSIVPTLDCSSKF